MQEQPDHFQTDLSVGEILRRTRMHYDQTLEDIERALHIRSMQLEAIETGNYSALPGKVYVIGFIRSYSEYLGLDGEKMVALYKKQSGIKTGPTKTVHSPVLASDTKLPQFWQVGVSIAAILVIMIVWWSLPGGDRSAVTEIPPVQTQAQIPAMPPTVAEPPQDSMPPQPATVENAADTNPAPVSETAATEPAATDESEKGVILNIKENSWVEIRGQDGKSIVSRVLQAGDRYYVPDRPDLTISLGNSGGVELEVQGKKLKPLGAPGEVKRNIPLDGAYLTKNYGS